MNTGNRPNQPRCTLARFIPTSPDTDQIKKEAWANERILVIQAEDNRLTWIERQVIEAIGNRINGKARNSAGS